MKKNQKYLFITGFLRSGTTLLQKIINQDPNLCVANQPSPFLFINFKKNFLHEVLGVTNIRYPLNTLFLRQNYASQDFIKYLYKAEISIEFIKEINSEMKNYSGQYLPKLLQISPQLILPSNKGTFLESFKGYLIQSAIVLNKTNSFYIGSKEVFCEEFSAFLCWNDIKVIHIIRDPRDMISSICGPMSSPYASQDLKLLFVIRQWRKSVASCLSLEQNPNFMYVRYEDLVKYTEQTLQKIYSFLDTPPLSNRNLDILTDDSGKNWQGNSSFETVYYGISDRSIGRYKLDFPEHISKLFEALCLPEMLAMGYALDILHSPIGIHSALHTIEFSELEKSEKQREIQRLKYVQSSIKLEPQDELKWFIFKGAYKKLLQAMSNS